MTAVETGLQDLKRQHPEWEPWLAVVQQALSETTNPEWNSFVPARAEAQQGKVPLLAGVTLALDKRSVRRLQEQLFRIAHRSGTPEMATLESPLNGDLDILKLLEASICQDGQRLQEIAAGLGVDAEAFQAVAALLPLPLLHACNRAWASSKSVSWMEGYCPVCGAWPAFAEMRGIERNRYLRCGRCGGGWQSHCLFCPYCGMTDHNELVSLVPEKGGASSVIEACKRCLGYVKIFTKLQGSSPSQVLLDDLASVDLDLAALEQGYKRPQGTGYSLAVKVGE